MTLSTPAGAGKTGVAGQVAVVTGGASGIGLAVAQRFAQAGATLVLLDRSPSVVGVAAALGTAHLGIELDVCRQADLSRAVETILARYGQIDILVNNAGVALLEPAVDVTEDAWDTTMAINLRSAFFVAQLVGKHMISRGYGRIVNLASQASVVALERHVAYCASKAGLVGMTKVLALEWAPFGVTVNAVSPTVVETELGKKAWAGEVGEAMKRQIPIGRFGQPQEVAAAILFLCDAQSGLITGENLMLDGGYTIK